MSQPRLYPRLANLSQRVWHTLLHQKEGKRAWELLHQLKLVERARPLHMVIDALLQRSRIHQPKREEKQWLKHAAGEIAALPVGEESDRLWQRLAAVAAYQGDTGKAEYFARQIKDQETRAYAISGIIQALASHGDITLAKELLSTLSEEGARQDAMTAIITTLRRHMHIPEAFAFIDNLTLPWEKTYAAKILRSELLAHHRRRLAKSLNSRYALL